MLAQLLARTCTSRARAGSSEIVAPGHDGRRARVPDHLGSEPVVVTGKEGVVVLLSGASGEAVLWNSDDFLAVADWGIARRAHASTRSRAVPTCGRSATTSTIADATLPRLEPAGVRLAVRQPERGSSARTSYEDKTSLEIEEVDRLGGDHRRERFGEIHEELLAKLDAERGERFWAPRRGRGAARRCRA